MSTDPGTLELIAQQIGLVLAPLEAQLKPDTIIPFLAELGLQFPPALLGQSTFMAAVNAGSTAAGALPTQLSQLATDLTNGDDAAVVQDGVALVGQFRTIITSLQAIGTELSHAAGALTGMNSGDVTAFAGTLADNLLSYLVISYVETIEPGYVGLANLLGIVNYVIDPGVTGDPTHPPFVRKELALSNVQTLLTNPVGSLRTLYAWGDPAFDGTQMMPRLGTSLGLMGFPTTVKVPPGNSLTTPLMTVTANPATTPPGLLWNFFYGIPEAYNLTIPISDRFSLQLVVTGNFGANLQLTIVPPDTMTIALPTATLDGLLQFLLTGTGTDATHPMVILGDADGSRIDAKSISAGAGLTLTGDTTGSGTVGFAFSAAITGGNAVIDTTNSDGFIADVLSGVHVEAPFEITITWGLATGLKVTGGAAIEIDLPLHLTLGPVTLPILHLIGGISSSGITLEVSAALGVTLGPIDVAVDRLGAIGTLTFPDHGGGNLGPADIQVAFKPPSGLGIAIDAGLIAGGGYINFDPDKGQYSGNLQLSLADTIQVSAIAILDTVMPDGSKGFAFLFVITFNFPPIQLGFGFTLNGVGGLGGVNRTMSTDALQAAFRAHTLGAIMFPPDPINNAPAIISDMRTFFPAAEGRYLFGPLLEFGWGSPTLLTLTVGVILEVPDPIRIAILGLIDGGLPTQESALVELHIEVLGLIDFGAKTLSIDGTLYNSRVVIYTLTGDLALRFAWGSNRNFIFALGGFNPHFNTDGLNVPQLALLAISLGNGDNPRLSANSYFAVTSNTVQFGASVEASAHAGGFGVHGYVGYDVLFIISPFSFEFDFTATFDVTYDGATLLGLTVDGALSGPTPWHLHAHASISLVFFSVGKTIDLTWGDNTQVSIPARPVLPDLLAALADRRSWNAALPAGASAAVSLVAPKAGDTTLRVHPIGTLTVKETVVPLDLPITQYANATPADGTEFSITGIELDGQAESIVAVQDYFASGQFLTLNDADKLSRPSFELYDAGTTVGGSAVLHGQDVPRTVVYEEFYIDDVHGTGRFFGYYSMPANLHLALSAQGAGAQSPVKHSGLIKYADGPSSAAVEVTEPVYVVTSVIDLSVRSDIVAAGGMSYFGARAALVAYLTLNPGEATDLQIIPVHEAAA